VLVWGDARQTHTGGFAREERYGGLTILMPGPSCPHSSWVRWARSIRGEALLSRHSADPWQFLVRLARRRKLSLSFAESCTGGMLGRALTAVPGASAVFQGAIVAYANQAKAEILGVGRALLDREGAVSEAAALAMAEGARALFHSDIALSVTGIAGPGGGSAEKPVGTVWIGIAREGASCARRFRFAGPRESVREEAVRHAASLLLEAVIR